MDKLKKTLAFVSLLFLTGMKYEEPLVNVDNPVIEISKETLIGLYTGRITRWDHGESVVVILMPLKSKEHKSFLQFLGMPSSLYKRQIQRLTSQKRSSNIIYVENQRDMLRKVGRNANAIGYLSNEFILFNSDGVKRIKVTE